MGVKANSYFARARVRACARILISTRMYGHVGFELILILLAGTDEGEGEV